LNYIVACNFSERIAKEQKMLKSLYAPQNPEPETVACEIGAFEP
jgi:hypothetical protein